MMNCPFCHTELISANRLELHELRDTFKTTGTRSGAAYEAVEFALGHQLDLRGYEKCWSDEAWMWGELSKIYEKQRVVT